MKRFLILLFTVSSLVGCTTNRGSSSDSHEKENAIYYWKTTFILNEYERNFLKDYNISKIYIKFFDVGLNNNYEEVIEPMPIATTRFKGCVPEDIQVVPTVYITVDALKKMDGDLQKYTGLIISRVQAMMTFNKLGALSEIQLDCDWTESTRALFYDLCRTMKNQLVGKSIALSSTIRLHQLWQSPPPVDKGVLMIYNTSDIRQYNTENSILTYYDVDKYIGRRVKYDLPLDFAYPNFAWGAVFESDMKFKGIYYGLEKLDFSKLSPVGKNKYQSDEFYSSTLERGDPGYLNIWNGDIIRVEKAEPKIVLQVKELAEKNIKGKHNSVIYHLDSAFLSRFTDEQIRKIYNID